MLEHFKKFHDTLLTKKLLEVNTLVIEKANERHELTIKESLLILHYKINRKFIYKIITFIIY